MIGETVTHYRILDKIGEGGMGVVYRAEDTRLGRQVAVKFLSAKLSQDPVALERFQREARAASSLNHPHICALYDIGQHGELPFLVMELLDGTTLRRRLRTAPLPIDDRCSTSACRSPTPSTPRTRAASIHRDIKSANIFVTERGQVKMLDFGLAKLTHRARRRRRSVSGHDARVTDQRPTTGQTLGTLVVHVARAGARRRARRAQRPVLVRRRALRDGDRPRAVHRPDVGADLRRDPAPARRRGRAAQPAGARRARSHHRQGAREGSRRCATRPPRSCAPT